MGATYKTPRSFEKGRSVFIATASYEHVQMGYAYALAQTTAELTRHGIPYELGLMEGNCHVDDGRNTLVRDFLEGNCTDLLFIDADMMWNAGDVIKILSHKDELVCGAYPLKCNTASYPIGRIFHTRPDGLLEVSYAPTGFMRIRRSVFEKLWPIQSKHGKERPTAVFFERRFNGNTRDGGDVTFCRKWIAEGGKVVVDPTFVFSHIGDNRWAGKFIDYLSKDENRAKHISECKDPLIDRPIVHGKREDMLPHLIERIRNGEDEVDVFMQLADCYDNKPWAATAEFLHIAYHMAKNLPEDAVIFEAGSGISTTVLAAAGRKVIAFEEFSDWANNADKVLQLCGLDAKIIVTGMNGKWYDGQEYAKSIKADMIVIDGPRRSNEYGPREIDRLWPLKNTGVCKHGIPLIIDDVSSLNVPGVFEVYGIERKFAAGRFDGVK